jgi:alpha-2-macroglobulin
MRVKATVVAIAAMLLTMPTGGQPDDTRPYFSLNSSRTYAPGEKPTIQLWAQNVDQLDFRVYRVKDPVAFFSSLEDQHRYGGQAPPVAHTFTPIEKFHNFKRRCRNWVRDLFRAQFSSEARVRIRTWSVERRQQKVAPAATSYAEAPLLNPQQVVSVWKQGVGRGHRWESQTIPIAVPGKGVYVVEAVKGQYRAYTIVMVSEIAVITKTSPGRLLARVLTRRDGAPIAGCKTMVIVDKKVVGDPATNEQGIIDVKIVNTKPENVLVMARREGDFAMNAPYGWNLGNDPDRSTTAYIYTDRPVYRPGHTVHFKALLRTRPATEYRAPTQREVQVEIHDTEGQTALRKTLPVSPMGTVHGEFDLAAAAPLGYYSIELRAGESRSHGGFEVEEYKKPEYEVRVTPDKRRVLQGETAQAIIDARYFFGEPVANAKVTYTVHRSRYWFPYYQDEEDLDEPEGEDDNRWNQNEQLIEETGKLDSEGRLTVRIPTQLWNSDARLRVEARVTDQANREISGSGTIIATRASFMLVARPEQYVYQPGDVARIKIEARDYDASPVQTAFRAELKQWRGRKEGLGPRVHETQGRTDAQGAAAVDIPIQQSGSWRVIVTATTPEGREVEDTVYLWVGGGLGSWFSERRERIEMVPDKKSYKPGETARVLLITGVSESDILVASEGREMHSYQVIKAKGPTATVSIPITAAHAPNFFLSASFLRDNQFYHGTKSIRVPATDKQLKVEIKPSKKQFLPGESAEYTVEAADAEGRPVAAEFSLGLVDEAIYSIRRDSTQDIFRFFYGRIWNVVNTESSLSYEFHGEAGKRRMVLASLRPRTSFAQLKPERLVQPNVRKAFPDTALWLADLTTDASGRARTRLNFPDALTTWRATARGITADTRVGSAVQKTIVRKNLILRLSTPRFFTEGDEVSIGGLVHNYLPGEKTVRMSLEVSGAQIIEGATRDVKAASRGEAHVEWRVRATAPGQVKLLAKALTDEESDALELTLPAHPRGVKLSEARSGSLERATDEARTNIVFPAQTSPASHTLEVSVTPSLAGAVFGALEYLTSFPYGCTEQTMSSFLPNVVVAEAMKQLNVKTDIDPGLLKKKIQAGLDRLYEFQHEDGGWGWWQTDDSQLFMSAYVVSGLAQARAAGYPVREDSLKRATTWLAGQWRENPRALPDLRAYVAYALVQAGVKDPGMMDAVWSQRQQMTAYGQALVGLALHALSDARAAEVSAALEAAVQSDEREASWPVDRDNLMDFYGDATPEATAYALKLLTRTKPQSPLLAKAAFWLVAHRSEGFYWYSTKQTAMVIYGLTDYLKASGELKPNMGVTVTVNGKQVFSKQFGEADALSPAAPTIRLNAAALAGANEIRVTKNGSGRLYWSARAEYFSTEQKLARTGSVSLNLLREYFRLAQERDGEKIVYRFTNFDGTLKPGDVLAVRLTVSGGNWRYLMTEDPIPAGLEFIERDDLYEIRDKPSWWSWWFNRREFHDDRAAIFQTYFDRGQAQYVYLLKAVNPGRYQVNPARIQPMYQPRYLSTTEARIVEVK